jgi:hypothetical protein
VKRSFFTEATPADIAALEKLASELRTDRRRRKVAEGLPIQDVFDHYFAEQAGRCGAR